MGRLSRFVFVAPLIVLVCSCADSALDTSYATRAEAEAAVALHPNLFPTWLPPEAFELHEVHDIESGESALFFRLPATLAWQPSAAMCQHADAGQFYEPAFDREWIPDSLDRYDFYSCPDRTVEDGSPLLTALAISENGQHVLYWRYIAP